MFHEHRFVVHGKGSRFQCSQHVCDCPLSVPSPPSINRNIISIICIISIVNDA